jgi:hypothetical protein
MVNATPRPLYPRERDLAQTVQETGWAQGRSGMVRKISPQLEFDFLILQPVVSGYTEYAALAHLRQCTLGKHQHFTARYFLYNMKVLFAFIVMAVTNEM